MCGAVPGQPISFNEPNDDLFCEWGRALAQLHFAAVSFRSDQFEYGNWNEEAIELKSYIDNNDVVINNELETVIRYFDDLLKTEFNFGLIHGDHRKGNVLTDGQKFILLILIYHVIIGLWTILLAHFLALSCKNKCIGKISCIRISKVTHP